MLTCESGPRKMHAAAVQGLLVAHELRERLRPCWLPREEMPSTGKVLEAITHRSCSDAVDFERYEFLGDAFLKFAVASHLFSSRGADASEGQLSVTLHRSVSNGTLWRCAVVCSVLLLMCRLSSWAGSVISITAALAPQMFGTPLLIKAVSSAHLQL